MKSKLMNCLLVCGLSSVSPFSGYAPNTTLQSQELFSLDVHDETALDSLIEYSVQNRIPMGFVLSDDSTLCSKQKRVVLKKATTQQVIAALLSNTTYRYSYEDGVFVVKPEPMPESSERILRLRYDHFKSPETTFQGVGVYLSGYIRSALDPKAGFATSILSSSDSTKLQPIIFNDVTVEQIANRVVSLDGKGVWVLDPYPFDAKKGNDSRLHIFGYEEDTPSLRQLSCPSK